MVKNVSIRFTAASSAANAAVIDGSSSLCESLDSTTRHVDCDSSVQLVAISDEDSDSPESYYESNVLTVHPSDTDTCDNPSGKNKNISANGTNPLDENNSVEVGLEVKESYSPIQWNSQGSSSVFNFKKKKPSSHSSKVDKLVKQIHESFIPSTTGSSISKSDTNISKVFKANKSDGILDSNSEEVEISNSTKSETSSSSISTPVISNSQHGAKSSPTSTSQNTSWFSDMKFSNFVNFRDKRADKKIDDPINGGELLGGLSKKSSPVISKTSSSHDGPLVSSGVCSVGNQSFLHCGNCTRETDQNSKCASGRVTPTVPLSWPSIEAICDSSVDSVSCSENQSTIPTCLANNRQENVKDKKSKEMFKDKESKKLKLLSLTNTSNKKSNDSFSFVKQIISPSKSSINILPVPSSSTSASLSTNKNNDGPKSQSSSSENLSLQNDIYNQLLVNSVKINPKPSNKISSSKSMISFRKLMKNEEAMLEADAQLNNVSHSSNQKLRRRAVPEGGILRESPTNSSLNEDRLSTSSSSSTENIVAEDALSKFHPPSFVLHSAPEESKIQNRKRQSLWTTWNLPFSKPYYLFILSMVSFSFGFYFLSPLPSFVNGFIYGLFFSLILILIFIFYVFTNYFLIKSDDSDELHRSVTPDSVSLKRNKSKKMSINCGNSNLTGSETSFYAGWMYEFIGDYGEREKNGFLSQLVYATLYGSKLYLYTPSQDLNEKKLKQLIADPTRITHNYSTQRIIDFGKLNHKLVTLYLTKNVRNQRKYIWSKKYPICIEFNDDRIINGGGYTVLGKDGTPEVPVSPSDKPKRIFSTPVILKLVIFARTCREKEEWFWAFKNTIEATIPSSSSKCSNSSKSSALSLTDSTIYSVINDSVKSYSDSTNVETNIEGAYSDFTTTTNQYLHILTRRLNYESFMRTNVLNAEGIGPGCPGIMTPLTWFNVLLNRLSFDILNKPNWSAYIAKKLQRKLRRLRLPYFMESLTITEIDIGTTLPKFNSVPSVPSVNEAGLWIDFDVSYSGGFTMTLETKINLMKLKTNETGGQASENNPSSSGQNTPDSTLLSPTSTPLDSPILPLPNNKKLNYNPRHWCGYKYRASITPSTSGLTTDMNEELTVDSDSDLDSIVTSSEDEEPETAPADPDDADTDEKQKKLIRFVNKIASSQYFQKVTQINFFKKALEGVSNMSIMLTVQINSLSGTLAINIPEPPTDRLWYGFRNEPTIQISARPKLGDHDLNLHYVTNYIEKKLRAEFFNYFVIPNMDDFFIPALNTNIEQYVSVVP